MKTHSTERDMNRLGSTKSELDQNAVCLFGAAAIENQDFCATKRILSRRPYDVITLAY
jgi:hypothetical protein